MRVKSLSKRSAPILTTPNDAGCQRMYPDEFGPKKKPFGFNFMGLLTAQNVLVSLAGAKAGLENIRK